MSSCNLQLAEGHQLLAAPGRPGRTGTHRDAPEEARPGKSPSKAEETDGFQEQIKDKVDLIKRNLTDSQEV